MKFLVFNVLVITAIVHLYTDKNITFEKLGDWIKGQTEQVNYLGPEDTADTDRRNDLIASPTPEKKRPEVLAMSALAAPPETKKSAVATAAPPSPADIVRAVPTVEPPPAKLRSELAPTASAAASVTKKSKWSAPSPEAQRRRAKILGNIPVPSVNKVDPLPSRRQKLLSLAEEMELFSIEVNQ